ncbi:hypothetical protein BpHYR1_053448 [Brachionus plicatilis]|uniref:Uncharacterized protein n=1 Tax=Brachionus plicatilis TaxID=10195 RepID=A0A3M7PDU0_BRAPC|nr:hypothetical protein BpHYR1_053448 [Brachionus plicatilis]
MKKYWIFFVKFGYLIYYDLKRTSQPECLFPEAEKFLDISSIFCKLVFEVLKKLKIYLIKKRLRENLLIYSGPEIYLYCEVQTCKIIIRYGPFHFYNHTHSETRTFEKKNDLDSFLGLLNNSFKIIRFKFEKKSRMKIQKFEFNLMNFKEKSIFSDKTKKRFN